MPILLGLLYFERCRMVGRTSPHRASSAFVRADGYVEARRERANGSRKGRVMGTGLLPEVDFIEELRLRRWARENYVPADEREPGWHPIILEEMRRKDGEVNEAVLVS